MADLKSTVLSTNNIGNIYAKICKKFKLTLKKDQKEEMCKLIVDEIKKVLKTVKMSNVNKTNFDKVVNEVNLYGLEYSIKKVKKILKNDFDERSGVMTRDESDDESVTVAAKRMEEEYQANYVRGGERPSTPDFSLEPKTKKQIEKERREKESRKAQEQKQKQQGNSLDDCYKPLNKNPDETYDELDNIYNNSGHNGSSYYDNDEYNNVNSYTTGVDPSREWVDDCTSLDQQIENFTKNRNNDLNNKRGNNNNMSYQQPVYRPQPYQQRRPPNRPVYQTQGQYQPMYQEQQPPMYSPQQQVMYPPQQQVMYQPQPQQTMYQPPQQVMYQPQPQQTMYQPPQQQSITPQLPPAPINGSMADLHAHINMLTSKNEEYRIALEKCSIRIKELDSGDKFKLLEDKKREVHEYMEKCKEAIDKNKKLVDEQTELDNSIKTRQEEFRKTIEKNVSLYTNAETNEIITSNKCTKNSNILRYDFQQPVTNLSIIELNSYSFPETCWNITNLNNTLYMSSDAPVEFEEIPGIKTKKNGDTYIFTFAPGNYNTTALLSSVAEILEQFEIRVNIDNNFLSLQSSYAFCLYDKPNYKNNLVSLLEFDPSQLNEKTNSLISERQVELKSEKVINMYINNIDPEVAFAKVNISSKRNSSFVIQLSRPIKSIAYFEFEFKDTNGNVVFFGNKDIMLDFTLKHIRSSLPVIDTSKNSSAVKENDLYDYITNLMQNA